MIDNVEKKYFDGSFTCYKITYKSGKVTFVPHNEANVDYQAILEWVANGGTIVDNGS